jgi:hypothetical protein
VAQHGCTKATLVHPKKGCNGIFTEKSESTALYVGLARSASVGNTVYFPVKVKGMNSKDL